MVKTKRKTDTISEVPTILQELKEIQRLNFEHLNEEDQLKEREELFKISVRNNKAKFGTITMSGSSWETGRSSHRKNTLNLKR